MTTAKIVPAPAEGHGLIDGIASKHFAAYSKGEPIGLIPAMVLLKVHGQTARDTAHGRHRSVQYELVKLEPIIEPGDREDAMWKIQSLYENRTSTGEQRALPIGLATEERRQLLMERIEEWSKQQDPELTGGQLERKWRDHFGVGNGDQLYEIPGDYRKAGVQHLLQFAIEIGAEPRPDSLNVEEEPGDDGTGDDDE